jgi:hypothetical protein
MASQSSGTRDNHQKANVYAVDAASGNLVWKVHVVDHFAARVTAASQLQGGVLYVPVASFEEPLALSPTYECCTFRGSVVALDAATEEDDMSRSCTKPPTPFGPICSPVLLSPLPVSPGGAPNLMQRCDSSNLYLHCAQTNRHSASRLVSLGP